MKFSEDAIYQGYYISGYDDDEVLVNGNAMTSSFVICSDQLIQDWSLSDIGELCNDHLGEVIQLEPELVLLGTGSVLRFPSVEQYHSLVQNNIGVEIMDTFAACRTYNILLGEGRRVVAGIIL